MTTPAGTFSYSYDAGGRAAGMTNPFSETTSWAYQNNNWLSTQTLANGAVATYTHNALGQVTELLNQIGSTTISDLAASPTTALAIAIPSARVFPVRHRSTDRPDKKPTFAATPSSLFT
jgi:YD repeat-containing protein